MAAQRPAQAKIAGLEGLRGLMALWVIAGHLAATFGWQLGLIGRSTLAVDVFILLSGFVITRLLDVKDEPFGVYILRRGFRIFPLYLIALFLSALLLDVQQEAWAQVSALSPANVSRLRLVEEAGVNLPLHLLTHIPLAQGLIPEAISPRAAFTILGQAWSISLEWQFYLVAPALLACATSSKRWWLAAIIVLALLAISPLFGKAFLGAKILHFVIGGASYFLVTRGPSLTALGLILAAATGVIALEGKFQVVALGVWFVALTATVGRLPVIGAPIERVLSSSLLRWLGETSYSVYLIHMIPLYSSIVVFSRLGLTGASLSAGVVLATVVGSYVLSAATYYGIERRGIALGARIAGKLQTLGCASASKSDPHLGDIGVQK
ncbi:acyltransferase family protein [Caulobacter endophyticus]|uniref:acyltransferase family protein n=1 Tax=Caulobacter endophyticus TaxID=2172652 RepID=UPI0024108C9F|nr:acyltransferase [Caulobacter endophyticus]MDG2531579.1 acyltransferase [Caulobacter endophyticus]